MVTFFGSKPVSLHLKVCDHIITQTAVLQDDKSSFVWSKLKMKLWSTVALSCLTHFLKHTYTFLKSCHSLVYVLQVCGYFQLDQVSLEQEWYQRFSKDQEWCGYLSAAERWSSEDFLEQPCLNGDSYIITTFIRGRRIQLFHALCCKVTSLRPHCRNQW